MKKQTINFDKLQDCDIVVTGGRGLFGYLIRAVTRGFKKRHAAEEVATHVGIAMRDRHGEWGIYEMLGEGLAHSSFTRYTQKNRRKILSIVRFHGLTNRDRSAIAYSISKDYHGLPVRYDWRHIMSFVFKKVEENPSRRICSEYTAAKLIRYGDIPCIYKSEDIVPADFQAPFNRFPNTDVREVKGWEAKKCVEK